MLFLTYNLIYVPLSIKPYPKKIMQVEKTELEQ